MVQSGMAMPSSAPSSTVSSSDALSTVGLDMTNVSVQMDFLMQLLDDTEIQVLANSYATRFWYGIIVAIALAGIFNVVLRVVLRLR